MTIDATFWVAISFFIFLVLLLYFKIPKKVKDSLENNINSIKKQIENAEKLKEEAKSILSEQEKKLGNSKKEIKSMIDKANEYSEKNIIEANKEFHNQMENRKKNAEERIRQMKEQAIMTLKMLLLKLL